MNIDVLASFIITMGHHQIGRCRLLFWMILLCSSRITGDVVEVVVTLVEDRGDVRVVVV